MAAAGNDESYLKIVCRADIFEGEVLGIGGFGIVRKGSYLGRDVAIKYLLPKGLEFPIRELRDLKKEARILFKAIDHEYIINIHGAVFEHDMNAIILEYMQFGNAAKFIQHYEVELPLKMRIVCQICSAMNWLHTRDPPVKHLDLKADNVLINNYFIAKLCDFGLSHLKTKTMTKTSENARRGTITHVAPEVLEDINVELSTEQDVYAFAIFTWEIFSGKNAFDGHEMETVRMCVKEGQRPNLRHLPDNVPQIRAMIANCWTQDPMLRPSFQNLYPDLNQLYLQCYEPGEMLACQNIRKQICDKFQQDPEHYREDYQCTSHFDSVPSPECDAARSLTRDTNAPLVDRDDNSVDAHPTLAQPALLNGNASFDDHQRGTDHVEGMENLTIYDPQENFDDNVDVVQQSPTVAAVPFGVMASPDPDRSQPNFNVVPKRLGPVLDTTPVPAPRNTRPGVWSNLDETSLQLRNDAYPVERNTTDTLETSILGQPVPNARVLQPEILGQPAPRQIIQPGNLGQSAQRPIGQSGNQGQFDQRLIGQSGNQGQFDQRPKGQSGNQGQFDQRPIVQSGNQGQFDQRPIGQSGNQGQFDQRPIGQSGNQGQFDQRPKGQPGNQGQFDQRPIGQSGNQGQFDQRPIGQSGILGQPSVMHRLESHVSVDQHPSGRSNPQPHGTSERDQTGAAAVGGATPLVISHKHAGGGFTQIEINQNCTIPPNIQIGNGNKMVIHENGGRKKEKRRKSSSKKCDVNKLTTSDAQLTQDQVDVVAAGLGMDWKTLCRLKLTLTDPEIEQLEHDYHVAGLYEITYQAIRRWQQKLGSAATQRKMALYLWEIDRDDLAQQLKLPSGI